MITLSAPRIAPGQAQIRARGTGLDAIVADVEQIGPNRWRARLRKFIGQPDPEGEEVFGASLKALRAILGARIVEQGRWWMS